MSKTVETLIGLMSPRRRDEFREKLATIADKYYEIENYNGMIPVTDMGFIFGEGDDLEAMLRLLEPDEIRLGSFDVAQQLDTIDRARFRKRQYRVYDYYEANVFMICGSRPLFGPDDKPKF